MKKFDVDFEMQYRVEIENPEAVQAYFVDGCWKEVFWDLDDLEDFCRSLSLSFDRHPEHWDRDRGGFSREVEGFGVFHQGTGERAYRLTAEGVEEIGSEITIEVVGELEPMFVTERE